MAGTTYAAEYVDSIQSPVLEAAGDKAALTRRAATCLAQNGGGAGQAIQTDTDGGTTVAPMLFPYRDAGIPWSVRSTLTVEAKDGRFRMTHTNLTHMQGGPASQRGWSIFDGSTNHSSEREWARVGKWRFSGGERVETAAQELSQKIAACIQKTPIENW